MTRCWLLGRSRMECGTNTSHPRYSTLSETSTVVSEPPAQPPAQPGWPIPASSENPLREFERRAADQSPAWLMPRLMAVQNQGQMWEDFRQRTIDDHIVGLRERGAHDLADKWLEAKRDMGAISVVGDTYHVTPGPPAPPAQVPTTTTSVGTTPAPAPAPNPAPTATTTTPTKPTGLSSLLWPVVIGGALLGTGVGGTMLYNYLTNKPSSVTTITNPDGKFEYRYGIEQRPTPSNP
jgi:hypothetical protein